MAYNKTRRSNKSMKVSKVIKKSKSSKASKKSKKHLNKKKKQTRKSKRSQKGGYHQFGSNIGYTPSFKSSFDSGKYGSLANPGHYEIVQEFHP